MIFEIEISKFVAKGGVYFFGYRLPMLPDQVYLRNDGTIGNSMATNLFSPIKRILKDPMTYLYGYHKSKRDLVRTIKKHFVVVKRVGDTFVVKEKQNAM